MNNKQEDLIEKSKSDLKEILYNQSKIGLLDSELRTMALLITELGPDKTRECVEDFLRNN